MKKTYKVLFKQTAVYRVCIEATSKKEAKAIAEQLYYEEGEDCAVNVDFIFRITDVERIEDQDQ